MRIFRDGSDYLSSENARYHTRFLISVLQIEHGQRPCVASALNVDEWNHRQMIEGDWVIWVRNHKTTAMGPAVICLNPEELEHFAFYITTVRPMFSENLSEGAPFFVNRKGARILQTTAEPKRLGILITSSLARKAYQNMVVEAQQLEKKESLNSYLHHSEATASSYYRNIHLYQVKESRDLMRTLEKASKQSKTPRVTAPGSPQPGPSHRPDFSTVRQSDSPHPIDAIILTASSKQGFGVCKPSIDAQAEAHQETS